MANFGVSIFDDNIYHVNASGNVITVIDYSNYDTSTEVGHTQADFLFKQIRFINPDGTQHLFSTEGDGDELLSRPSVSVLPISTFYEYTTGDGVYTLILYSVPVWRDSVQYNVINNHCVIHNGEFYRCIQNNTSVEPGQNPDYWMLIGQDDLPNKYMLTHKFAVYCDTIHCYLNMLVSALCSAEGLYCGENLCDNHMFMTVVKLSLLIDSITYASREGNWAEVSHLINLARQICCCNE